MIIHLLDYKTSRMIYFIKKINNRKKTIIKRYVISIFFKIIFLIKIMNSSIINKKINRKKLKTEIN